MGISFNCEKCGKKIEAPDSAGGKRGRCPYCQASNYIPSPVAEDDIYELAPEDSVEEARRQKEMEEIREHTRTLIAEMGSPDAVGPGGLEMSDNLKPEDLHPLIINYCIAMHASKLERAQKHMGDLKKVKRMARSEVDRFLAGDILEPALDPIPMKLRMGYLDQLKKALA